MKGRGHKMRRIVKGRGQKMRMVKVAWPAFFPHLLDARRCGKCLTGFAALNCLRSSINYYSTNFRD